MSGGTDEYVMGNYNMQPSKSGFTMSELATKYIDVYEVTNINASHLGDALGETAGWYNDYANFLDSMFQSYWFVRGGAYSYGYGSGIFCFGRDDGSINNRHAFRTVLSVTE